MTDRTAVPSRHRRRLGRASLDAREHFTFLAEDLLGDRGAPGDARPGRALDALLLGGDDPTCVQLREQYARATIREVELTGAGFFVVFDIPAEVARAAPANFQGGAVNIRAQRVENGAGCLLFVRDGVLSFLEGYTYGGEEWPEHPVVLELRDPPPTAPQEKGGPSPSHDPWR